MSDKKPRKPKKPPKPQPETGPGSVHSNCRVADHARRVAITLWTTLWKIR